jgi:curved DNA-binding protein CbpA
MNFAKSADPFTVLGVPQDAGEAEIRARYLELVKQFPPERDPDKFREVRAAYEAAKDPLSIARRLIAPPGDDVPKWSDVIEAQKRNPPRLTPAFVLSLGNRATDNSRSPATVSTTSVDAASDNAASIKAANVNAASIPAESQPDNDPTPSRQAMGAS